MMVATDAPGRRGRRRDRAAVVMVANALGRRGRRLDRVAVMVMADALGRGVGDGHAMVAMADARGGRWRGDAVAMAAATVTDLRRRRGGDRVMMVNTRLRARSGEGCKSGDKADDQGSDGSLHGNRLRLAGSPPFIPAAPAVTPGARANRPAPWASGLAGPR